MGLHAKRHGCEVAFFVDFEFRSRILQAAIGVVFNEAVRRMVNAFLKRARDVYGPPPGRQEHQSLPQAFMVYAPIRQDRSLPPVRVNLYSDTQTRPSAGMKDAMMRAEVGDEQHGDDPTINALCDRMAALTGKQAAMFLPTGTMCNQIAILTHCRPGDEILAHESAHIITNEGGGPGALAGAVVLGLRGARGMFDSATLQAALREPRRNAPPQTLVEVEQTANAGGGAVWPVAQLNDVLSAAHGHGLRTHMDGARLMNAVVAAGVPARGDGGAVRLRLARLHQGPRRAAGRRPVRLGGVHRRGLALEAAAGRLAAPGRHLRRRLPLRAGPQYRPPGRGPCQRPHPRARAGADPGLAVEDPETNLVFFDTRATGLTADALAGRVRQDGDWSRPSALIGSVPAPTSMLMRQELRKR